MEKQAQATPAIGMVVKLRKGQLQLSARQVQHITGVKELEVNEGRSYDARRPYLSQSDIDGEGGFWIQTEYTKGEWWAWSLFRIA
jgi:hypothetical protein